MKVLIISHSAVVPIYREKFYALAALGCEVHLVLPPGWPEGGRCVVAPAAGKEQGIYIHRLPARFIGKVGGFHLLGLSALVAKIAPDLIHAEEEPFSIVTWQALCIAKKRAIPLVFFTWENILRTYKFPLQWIDRWVLQHTQWAIAGNKEVEAVLTQRGYRGKSVIIPQYGVNPDAFRPFAVMHVVKPTFTIGFFGRICEEKGIVTLLRAVQDLHFTWRLLIVGNGPYASEVKKKVQELGLEKKVVFAPAVDNAKMPKALQQVDVLVLPSETTAAWKEQFGRVLIEAMACEIPVIGSDSGEIPHVIGEAGYIFPEKDWKTLAHHIQTVHHDSHKATHVGKKGRERVLSYFTTKRIAEQTLAWYQTIVERKH